MASKAGGVTELLRCVERSSDSGEWQNLQWFSISRHSIPEIPAQFCRRLIWHRLRTADDVMIRAFQHRMTLEQLKRHMDRRFDRLQRTKADKSDLKRFATKSQFRRLRMDLKRFATKHDLKRFATKDDLKLELERYTTKEETRTLAAEMFRRFDSLNDKIDSVLRRLDDVYNTHDRALTEHDLRLKDLEARVL